MLELNEYIQKVIWYAQQEYDAEPITVEQFYQTSISNIMFNFVFDHYVKNTPFQNCAGSLIKYLRELAKSE
jgi:hypothetical protein